MSSGKTLLVAITGNSGCGQTTAASFVEGLVTGICSLDRIGHRLLEKEYVLRELEEALGMSDAGTMGKTRLRRKLSGIVFSDPDKMEKLNYVVHPRMKGWAGLCSSILSRRGGIWVLEGALIFELGLDDLFHRTVVIRDTLERCALRLESRDGISREMTENRWSNQMPMEEKVSRGDFVADNSRDADYLRGQILSIFAEIRNSLNS
ncbi:MAG: dephospho-CoA kinase [Candidatus Aegiribacteria sp.]